MMIKLMVFAVVLACAAPLFIKGPDGRPLMTLDDWIPDFDAGFDISLDDVKRMLPLDTPSADGGDSGSMTTIYRWKDEKGVWQFSNEPVEGAETILVDSNINLIPDVETKPKTVAASPSPSLPVGTIPSGQVAEVLNQAQQMQETVDSRKADIDRLINQEQ